MILELSEIVKQKKEDLIYGLSGKWNHPHRLSVISATGTYTQIIDTRPVRTGFLTAQERTEVIEGNLIPVITRHFVSNVPFRGASPAPIQDQGKFAMMHDALTPWKADCRFGNENTPVKIGTETIQGYTRPNTSSPWTPSTSFASDIIGNMVVSILDGGESPSYGRGADIEASMCSIWVDISYLGLYKEVRRFPWDDPWDSETQIFTDFLADWITDGGLGYSGSTSLEIVFNS